MQGSGQPGPALHERFARAIAKTVMAPGFVIARPRRGRGNLAVPCRISGKPRRKRDRLREIATSAVGLLAMTNLGAIAFLTLARTSRRCSVGRGMPLPYNARPEVCVFFILHFSVFSIHFHAPLPYNARTETFHFHPALHLHITLQISSFYGKSTKIRGGTRNVR